MEVNVTVVLQAIQFACVYYFLYTFLFAPASSILDAQEAEKQELYKNLEQAQQIKDALMQDYQVKNDAFKSILLQNIPDQVVAAEHQKPVSVFVVENFDQQNQLPHEDRQEIELFLVDRLSKVVKK